MKLIPEHGSCLVCGSANPHGFGVRWYLKEDGGITAKITLTEHQQGPPGFSHGGAAAALLDEAMGVAVWAAGHTAVAANLNVDFLKPIPLFQEIEVQSFLNSEGQEGKVVRVQAEIRLPKGEVAATSKGVFVDAPHLFS